MATKYWLDSGDNWATAGDWTGGTVPGSGDAVVIDQGDPNATAPIGVNSITIGPGDLYFQNAGATSQVTTNLTNGGGLYVDPYGNQGGTQLNIGGSLSNSNYTQIGNGSLAAATTVTTHYLNNTGTIELDGAASTQSTLNVGYTAGFGTLYTLTGTVRLFGDTLISFTSGQIKTLAAGSTLRLDGANARIADTGSTTTNSALTGLATINRSATLGIENGNSVAVTTYLANYGTINLDNYGTEGGSSLSIGAQLTNLGGIQIGNGDLSAATTLTTQYINNTGTITLDGSTSTQATLAVGYTAGFGTLYTVTGTVSLFGDALVSFGTGQITTLAAGSTLRLDGTGARIADVGSTSSNSALDGLGTINRNATLLLDNGSSITTNRNLSNYGTLDLDYYGTEGGSSLTVGGGLTNLGSTQIGNGSLSASDAINVSYVNNKGGTIELDAPNPPTVVTAAVRPQATPPTPQAVLNVGSAAGFGTLGTLVGTVRLFGNTLIDFASGQIKALADGSFLRLDGTSAHIADAGNTTSNSALTGLNTIGTGADLLLDNGASMGTTGNLANYGALELDYYGTEGSSVATVAGRLTNHNYVQIGNGGLSANDSLMVGSLVNTGTIDLYGTAGSSTNYQASLIDNAAAGTGTIGHLSGTVYLQNDTLLQFASGQINTIDTGADLRINGSNAFVADAGSTSSNSALNGLTENDGTLYLDNGASVATSGSLANYGNITLDYYYTESGSSMTVGGTLDNENYLQIGNGGQTLADVLTAGSLTNNGTINLNGNNGPTPNVTASLIVNSAAGTGSAGNLTGTISLASDSLLQFASGQINTIDNGANLTLNGKNAFVADAGSTSSNSALTGLTENDGTLYLENGASVATSGSVANYGNISLDYYYTESGSSMTIGGNLDNENYLQIGNGGQSLGEVLTAASLTNNGDIDLAGNGSTAAASLSISGSVVNNGQILMVEDTQTFSGAVSGNGTCIIADGSTLQFDGSVASGQTVNYNGGNPQETILGNAKSFAGSFSNFGSSDTIDLKSFAANSALSYTENAQGSAGVLTVGTGSAAAHLNFNGAYTTASFTAASDGGTGLLIGHA